MTAEEWALAASVFFSGLAAGLLGMLTTIMHPMFLEMDGREFRGFMEGFLRFARKSWFNYAWSLGVYVVANVWKEPHYDVILSWDPDALPADWEEGRRWYFTINWIQFVTTWAAFALFLAALISL